MRTRFAATSIALVLGIVAAQSAEAQRRRGIVDISPRGDRHGFWINLGVGAGSESSRLEPEANYSTGLTKPTFSLRLGGTVSPNLRLGAELTGWADPHFDQDLQDNVTSYVGGAFLIGQFYPSTRAGLFFKGGLGVTSSGEAVPGPGDLDESGFGYTVGAGYEVRLSRSLYLTPTMDLLQHRSQIRDFDGSLLPAFHDRVVSFGVALTIQPGR